MPAIQLSRLRLQTGELRDWFSDHSAFIRKLKDIFEFYADRTHRSGKSGEPSPLLPAYNVPSPILRQVMIEVTPLIKAYPEQAETVMDELWAQSNLECRLLAISILGRYPYNEPETITERVKTWAKSSENRLLTALLSQGLSGLRHGAGPWFIILVEGWLSSSDWREQQLGLRALLPLVNDPAFDDFPVVFRLITPLVRQSPHVLRPDLVVLVKVLVDRSPKEIAYFLRQNLIFDDTPWLLRQVLRFFPLSFQENLRQALKNPQRFV